VLGKILHLPDGGQEASEQAAKAVQLAINTVPVIIQGMVEHLPVELRGPVLAAYEDENGEIKWGYFSASEVQKGYVHCNRSREVDKTE
jgi:hypothetical protein